MVAAAAVAWGVMLGRPMGPPAGGAASGADRRVQCCRVCQRRGRSRGGRRAARPRGGSRSPPASGGAGNAVARPGGPYDAALRGHGGLSGAYRGHGSGASPGRTRQRLHDGCTCAPRWRAHAALPSASAGQTRRSYPLHAGAAAGSGCSRLWGPRAGQADSAPHGSGPPTEAGRDGPDRRVSEDQGSVGSGLGRTR